MSAIVEDNPHESLHRGYMMKKINKALVLKSKLYFLFLIFFSVMNFYSHCQNVSSEYYSQKECNKDSSVLINLFYNGLKIDNTEFNVEFKINGGYKKYYSEFNDFYYIPEILSYEKTSVRIIWKKYKLILEDVNTSKLFNTNSCFYIEKRCYFKCNADVKFFRKKYKKYFGKIYYVNFGETVKYLPLTPASPRL